MANSDVAFLQGEAQNPLILIHNDLRRIEILLRQGFNLPDEASSLTEQPKPTIIS